jgi:nicotinamide-nucleotide amidase
VTAGDVIATLTRRGETVATAESLTGGLLCGALTSVPGASSAVRGGLVSYAVDVKAEVLGVDAEILERRGAVDEMVAVQMAQGIRRLLGTTYGVATTGSAGPDPDPGGSFTGPVPPGRGFVAVDGPRGSTVKEFQGPPEDREAVRQVAVESAIAALRDALEGPDDGQGSAPRGNVEQ